MDLVATLKLQHRLIEQIIGRLNEHLHRSDRERIRLALTELKNTLDAHWALEDAELFPALTSDTSPLDAEQKERAATFSRNMVALSGTLAGFFQIYGAPEFDLDGFGRDWGTICHALRTRMEVEEAVLYPLYHRGFGRIALRMKAQRARPAA